MANTKAKQIARQKAMAKKASKAKKRTTKATPKKPTAVHHPMNTPEHIVKPDTFPDFPAMVKYGKRYVYQVTRLRSEGNETKQASLGTAYLVGENRMMTCAHVVDDAENPDFEMAHHKDGDAYLFVNRDEESFYHIATENPEKNKTLFFDHSTDFAVFYLSDDFYKVDGKYLFSPEDHLRLCVEPRNIGSSVGILGYPLQGLQISRDGSLDISQIFLRGDRGVVNTRYFRNLYYYEFTIPFNPGNSGGPIFDTMTGDVIGMVHAFNSIPLRTVEDEVLIDNGSGTGVPTTITSILRTTYSIGLASENFKQYKDVHKLSFDS